MGSAIDTAEVHPTTPLPIAAEAPPSSPPPPSPPAATEALPTPAPEAIPTPAPNAAAEVLPIPPIPPGPSLTEMLPPPPPIISQPFTSAGPTRRGRKNISREEVESTMHHVYPLVLRDVNSGKSLNKAIQSSAVTRTTFFKYRYPAEMKIVDATHYEHLRQQYARNSTKLSEACKTILTDEDSPYFQQAQQKRSDKELLPLSS